MKSTIAGESAKASQTREQLNILYENLDSILDKLHRLSDKLSPVLREAPVPPPANATEAQLVPLAGDIRALNYKAADIMHVIDCTLESLEL